MSDWDPQSKTLFQHLVDDGLVRSASWARNMDLMRTRFERTESPYVLLDALLNCSFAKAPPPDWVVDGFARYFRARYQGALEADQGRTPDVPHRALELMKRDTRFRAVALCRWAQGKPTDALELEGDWPSASSVVEDKLRILERIYRRRPSRLGRTWDDAYVAASELLLNTPAFGAPATMRAAYQQQRKMSGEELDDARLSGFATVALGIPIR